MRVENGSGGLMAGIASRPGRKARPANRGQRVSLGLKVTPTVKNLVDAAAKESGRTQSQESEARLEASFLNQRLLDETLDIAYGRKNSAVLQLIAEVIRRASDHG